MIVIADYGMGNLGSIANMFKRVGVPSMITSDLSEIDAATKLVLPGVGSFDSAMERVEESGMHEILTRKALVERIPVLGICLGMQLLMDGSDEGRRPGLGWIAGRVHDFGGVDGFVEKVPHMGWNDVRRTEGSALTGELGEAPRFYFVHSYFVKCADPGDVILTARYGIEFDAAVHRENIYGVQFHPEKSHRYGMRLLRNFAEL